MKRPSSELLPADLRGPTLRLPWLREAGAETAREKDRQRDGERDRDRKRERKQEKPQLPSQDWVALSTQCPIYYPSQERCILG